METVRKQTDSQRITYDMNEIIFFYSKIKFQLHLETRCEAVKRNTNTSQREKLSRAGKGRKFPQMLAQRKKTRKRIGSR